MTVWVTKYALTKGILVMQLRDGKLPSNGGFVYAMGSERWFDLQLKWGVDGFATEAEAIEAARKMRDRKVASLKKQLAKLEKLWP